MANNNDMKNMYFGFLRELTYDGRTPIKDFLTDLGNITNEIATLDRNFPRLMWLTLLCASRQDAHYPPKKSVDGGTYTEKLKAKFNIGEVKTEAGVMAELRRLYPELSNVMVKMFSDEFNKVIGKQDIAGYELSKNFVAQRTQAILTGHTTKLEAPPNRMHHQTGNTTERMERTISCNQ
ncbi:hypothetical protein BDD12DRAFT_882576 [Trichophaea hybrida]|nr:hypothetical protein BDD12DRAFT_882576 [Trichophaea hybrida]